MRGFADLKRVAIYQIRTARFRPKAEAIGTFPFSAGSSLCRFLTEAGVSSRKSAAAGMVKWYHMSLPSSWCGFDSRYPLQPLTSSPTHPIRTGQA